MFYLRLFDFITILICRNKVKFSKIKKFVDGHKSQVDIHLNEEFIDITMMSQWCYNNDDITTISINKLKSPDGPVHTSNKLLILLGIYLSIYLSTFSLSIYMSLFLFLSLYLSSPPLLFSLCIYSISVIVLIYSLHSYSFIPIWQVDPFLCIM